MNKAGKLETYLRKAFHIEPEEWISKGIGPVLFSPEILNLGVRVLEPYFRDKVGRFSFMYETLSIPVELASRYVVVGATSDKGGGTPHKVEASFVIEVNHSFLRYDAHIVNAEMNFQNIS